MAQPEHNDIFKEVSTSSGLVFRHFNGMTGKFYFPEMTGQGIITEQERTSGTAEKHGPLCQQRSLQNSIKANIGYK